MIEDLFLGVGAMKAGTTWVYNVINKHPEIYFSFEKEVHYFAHLNLDMDPLSLNQRYARFQDSIRRINANSLDSIALRRKLIWYANYLSSPIDDLWYINLFSMRGKQKYCADFSNLYCHLNDDGWQHVRRIAKNIKVIYIMRHPWKRLWSHLRFHSAIIGAFENLKTWNKSEIYDFAKSKHIWINTQYSKCIRSLKRNLGDDELRIFFFEEIHRDRERWLFQLEEFLGVGHFKYDKDILDSKINASQALSMPEYFYDLFKYDFEREIEELEDLGLKVPDSWRN